MGGGVGEHVPSVQAKSGGEGEEIVCSVSEFTLEFRDGCRALSGPGPGGARVRL